MDARQARPGRGSLSPHRPAGRRQRLLPARGGHDRRDDLDAAGAQARGHRRGHRRASSTSERGVLDALVRELRGDALPAPAGGRLTALSGQSFERGQISAHSCGGSTALVSASLTFSSSVSRGWRALWPRRSRSGSAARAGSRAPTHAGMNSPTNVDDVRRQRVIAAGGPRFHVGAQVGSVAGRGSCSSSRA